ncbi:hypothetical protein [Acinetobacter larvae]|uniref:Uncharacterized protein n=1 Tax=Acinetobacter larvae TaxID=1789224 RepID=A0A1B2LYT9_9GAMM|nr:hypothetical protein [Acinetobacter larvae]AOA58095.1 hypothetical protein BFG52_06830 [Acinetobacter larvae]
MSYKHNNLAAIRQRYWHDETNPDVLIEKNFLQQLLREQSIFAAPSLEDAKYLFFALPSIIIVKGYALGFLHDTVKNMIINYIQDHKQQLMLRQSLKVQYRL